MTDYFVQAFIYLVAAVIAVSLARQLGLGSVLGYLVAGVVIGPVTGLVGQEAVTLQHFAEFGVVMILFLVGMVIVCGHYLSRPLFRYVVQSGMREVFTATSLMLIIGIAALMSLVNLSPALGAFLAGVVLANSEFRHELEANIEPFKGLLLGLFTLGLAQAGEFGFVLLTYSTQNRVIPADTAQMLSLVVALSMFLTPLLFIVYDRVVLPRYQKASNEEAEPDEIEKQAPLIFESAMKRTSKDSPSPGSVIRRIGNSFVTTP